MSLTEARSRLTPEFRTTAFYFTFYMGPGAAVMFLPIWLSEKGITTEQIGIINAVPVFMILALNLIVGRIADKASDWRQAIVIGALIAGIVPIGLFFVNGRRWPDLAAPWMGWHSLRGEEDWRKRAVALPKETMERFEAGNPAFLPGYLLNEGTGTLLAAGVAAIEGHVAPLAGSLRDGLVRLGLPVLTPAAAKDRAGNICFATERSMALEAGLREAGVLTWGGDGRLRISVHGYNDEGDVARALDALKRLGA